MTAHSSTVCVPHCWVIKSSVHVHVSGHESSAYMEDTGTLDQDHLSLKSSSSSPLPFHVAVEKCLRLGNL